MNWRDQKFQNRATEQLECSTHWLAKSWAYECLPNCIGIWVKIRYLNKFTSYGCCILCRAADWDWISVHKGSHCIWHMNDSDMMHFFWISVIKIWNELNPLTQFKLVPGNVSYCWQSGVLMHHAWPMWPSSNNPVWDIMKWYLPNYKNLIFLQIGFTSS